MNQDEKYFKSHFVKGYESEESNPTNKKKLREIAALGFSHGKLLDAGCAYGYFLSEADKLDFETYGIDKSNYAITKASKITKARLFNRDLSKDLIPLVGINVCVLLNTLEHIDNYRYALLQIKKVLKKGGLLVIFVPTETRWLTDKTHINFFKVSTLRFVLEEIGFKVEKAGEEGGKFQLILGLSRLIIRQNTNFNFVPEGTGSFISCFAIKK